MICPKCGTENNDQRSFCYKCGAMFRSYRTPAPTAPSVPTPAQNINQTEGPAPVVDQQQSNAPTVPPCAPAPAPDTNTSPAVPTVPPIPTAQPVPTAPHVPTAQPPYNTYGYPAYQIVQKPKVPVPGNGLGIASMILGILSLVMCCLYFLSIPLAIVGLVLGCVSYSKAKKAGASNGMAIAGIICSCISLVFWLIVLFVAIATYAYEFAPGGKSF